MCPKLNQEKDETADVSRVAGEPPAKVHRKLKGHFQL